MFREQKCLAEEQKYWPLVGFEPVPAWWDTSTVPLGVKCTHQCCVRVQVVKCESESSPLSPSPSPSHHLRVRVRVKFFFWVRVTNLVVHIFNICLSSKTWKQTTKCIECQSKQRNTARPLLLGLGRDSGLSHDFWVRVRVKVKKNWTRVRVPTRVTHHWNTPII